MLIVWYFFGLFDFILLIQAHNFDKSSPVIFIQSLFILLCFIICGDNMKYPLKNDILQSAGGAMILILITAIIVGGVAWAASTIIPAGHVGVVDYFWPGTG